MTETPFNTAYGRTTTLELSLITQASEGYDFPYTILTAISPPNTRLLQHLSKRVAPEGFTYLQDKSFECDSGTVESAVRLAHELATHCATLAQAENLDLTVRLDPELSLHAADVLM